MLDRVRVRRLRAVRGTPSASPGTGAARGRRRPGSPAGGSCAPRRCRARRGRAPARGPAARRPCRRRTAAGRRSTASGGWRAWRRPARRTTSPSSRGLLDPQQEVRAPAPVAGGERGLVDRAARPRASPSRWPPPRRRRRSAPRRGPRPAGGPGRRPRARGRARRSARRRAAARRAARSPRAPATGPAPCGARRRGSVLRSVGERNRRPSRCCIARESLSERRARGPRSAPARSRGGRRARRRRPGSPGRGGPGRGGRRSGPGRRTRPCSASSSATPRPCRLRTASIIVSTLPASWPSGPRTTPSVEMSARPASVNSPSPIPVAATASVTSARRPWAARHATISVSVGDVVAVGDHLHRDVGARERRQRDPGVARHEAGASR